MIFKGKFIYGGMSKFEWDARNYSKCRTSTIKLFDIKKKSCNQLDYMILYNMNTSNVFVLSNPRNISKIKFNIRNNYISECIIDGECKVKKFYKRNLYKSKDGFTIIHL